MNERPVYVSFRYGDAKLTVVAEKIYEYTKQVWKPTGPIDPALAEALTFETVPVEFELDDDDVKVGIMVAAEHLKDWLRKKYEKKERNHDRTERR